ncbi:MAG: GntR family transcriptional regulator [Lachnospiraceae bacterium]|nr:GntR family transcriptional regulator [Lachnospiraceae bacterium]MBQ3513376.1 GntR family transcriptional regulator [Lachnospiraceae bacterium]
MDIIISNSDKIPIYEQITKQIKDMILNGTLKEGEPLPSMRFLAKELRISMITTKRAYEELEREGFIESYVGKGSFVKAVNQEYIREKIQKEMEDAISIAVEKAKLSGISKEEFLEVVQWIYEES